MPQTWLQAIFTTLIQAGSVLEQGYHVFNIILCMYTHNFMGAQIHLVSYYVLSLVFIPFV